MSLRNAWIGPLMIAAIGLNWTLPASAAGCQYDMQCKGERICQQGQCMAPESDDSTDATQPRPLPPIKLSPQPASAQRSCCTVAGKLKLAAPQSGDGPLVIGDTCQGLTHGGKPVPGTVCN